jgi:hypothetical protein
MPPPPIVIPASTDRYKTSDGVEREGRYVVNCDLEDHAFSAATTRLDAYGIQKSHTDPFPPPFGQDPEREDLALFVEVEGQGEPGGHLAFPSDSAEESGHAYDLGDRRETPWISRKTRAVQYRQGAGHEARHRFETAAHRPALWCAFEKVTSGGRR